MSEIPTKCMLGQTRLPLQGQTQTGWGCRSCSNKKGKRSSTERKCYKKQNLVHFGASCWYHLEAGLTCYWCTHYLCFTVHTYKDIHSHRTWGSPDTPPNNWENVFISYWNRFPPNILVAPQYFWQIYACEDIPSPIITWVDNLTYK